MKYESKILKYSIIFDAFLRQSLNNFLNKKCHPKNRFRNTSHHENNLRCSKLNLIGQ